MDKSWTGLFPVFFSTTNVFCYYISVIKVCLVIISEHLYAKKVIHPNKQSQGSRNLTCSNLGSWNFNCGLTFIMSWLRVLPGTSKEVYMAGVREGTGPTHDLQVCRIEILQY